ncbi:MAG: PfkB family carbohydrate kinase, partial [Planctomycetota bacterium]
MDKLLAALDNWKPFVAVVVGDFMLDELVFGDAERLSADAPVPILHAKETRRTPGGAASLAMDLAAMRATVRLVGVTGDDAEARTLRDRLDAEGLDSSGLVTDTTRPTTVKRNLVGLAQARHPQKMFRLDFESREPVADAARTELLA